MIKNRRIGAWFVDPDDAVAAKAKTDADADADADADDDADVNDDAILVDGCDAGT